MLELLLHARDSIAFSNFYGVLEPLLNGWFYGMLALLQDAGTFTTCFDFDGMLGFYVVVGRLSILGLLIL